MRIKEQLCEPGRGKNIIGHCMTAPERYAPDTRHMVILDVRRSYTKYTTGGRVRMFLTDEGYNEVMQMDTCGDVKIIRHARVRVGELYYDAPEREQ